jgi:hypothetical protein
VEALPVKTYNETYVTFETGEGEDKSLKILPESRYNKQFEKVDPKPEIVSQQTFVFYEIATDEDAATLVPTDAERANIFNRGVVLKQQNGVRGLMLAEDWAPVEGLYDLADLCNEATERRAATPAEKMRKILGKLSPAELAAVLAEFQGAQAASA